MTRILQINSVCGVTSTGRIAADIHHRLVAAGFESAVAFARKKLRNCDNAYRFGGNINFLNHVIFTFLTDRHGFASTLATIRLIKFIRNYSPDLIHIHVVHGYYVNIDKLFQFLKQYNKPVVWTQHDCWSFTGHCAFFDYVKCDRWKTQCHHCPAKHDYPISICLDSSRSNYLDKKKLFNGLRQMVLVTPSQWLANLTQQSFLKNYPVRVVNNGIDLTVFKPSLTADQLRDRLDLNHRFVLLGVANVWTRRKGLKHFIDISASLNNDEKIVLIGLSKQQIRKLPENIIGIIRTDNVQQLADYYSLADVFVNPTLEDNFPTTNLESLACGTPVITFRTGGSVESITPKTGYIVEPGDSEQLLVKIREIKDKTKHHYSSDCRDHAVKFYDRDQKYQEYIKLYQELLAGDQ